MGMGVWVSPWMIFWVSPWACRIAGWVFELFLGDEFVLDLCFFEDPRGRWITCLSKGCTRHFLEKTLAISDCQFLKHWFLKVHFYFFVRIMTVHFLGKMWWIALSWTCFFKNNTLIYPWILSRKCISLNKKNLQIYLDFSFSQESHASRFLALRVGGLESTRKFTWGFIF